MPKFHLFYLLFKKPILLLTLLPIVPISNVVNFYSIIKVLTYLFALDLFTGICASYFDWKKNPEKTNKWFFGTGEGFSSDKFKKCFVKLIIYCTTPLVMRELQNSFKIKTFTYQLISTADIDVTTIVVLLFCANELYSTFHENLPRCGFNIFDTIRNIFKMYKSTKKEISE